MLPKIWGGSVRSDFKKKLDSFTLKTSKNYLIRNFVRNERLRVNISRISTRCISRPVSFLLWQLQVINLIQVLSLYRRDFLETFAKTVFCWKIWRENFRGGHLNAFSNFPENPSWKKSLEDLILWTWDRYQMFHLRMSK